VFQYRDDAISNSVGMTGIGSEPFSGNEICMKGELYMYNGNLNLTGDINKGILKLKWNMDTSREMIIS
jgi:hypothetical protein